MEPRRVGISNRAIAAIIVGILLLIAAGLVLTIRSTADRAWAAMELRTRELIAEARARPSARPVLRGTPEPGNAWTDYKAASKLMEPLSRERMTVYYFVARNPVADRLAVEKLIAAHGSIIALMRRGTRRSDVTSPYSWEEGIAHEVPPLHRLHELGMLSLAQARLQRDAGRLREAAELILDVAQCGGDLRRNAVLISDQVGLDIMRIAFDELRDLLAAAPLTTEDLAAIDRELDILDRTWADFSVTLRNESMAAQTTLLASDGDWPSQVPSFFETWKYGFSRKLMRTHAGAQIAEFLEQSLRQESLAWPDRLKASVALEKEFLMEANPLSAYFSWGGHPASACGCYRRTQVRMLRAAIQFRRSGEIAEFDDPFGTKLRFTVLGSTLKIWSLGCDGIDHGGKGDWTRDVPGADIVLEVSK